MPDAKMFNGTGKSQGKFRGDVARRYAVKHNDIGGTLGAAERCFSRHRLFDPPQAVLDVLGQADGPKPRHD
jgi:hypothetical protein